ncbi:MAG: hypothetical protein ACF8PN_00730 [Phycisphaerales bacterium]
MATAMFTTMASGHPGPGIVVDSNGVISFVYGPSSRVWRVTREGHASIMTEGGLDEAFRVPHHLYLDADGALITASDAGSNVWRITSDGARASIMSPANAKRNDLEQPFPAIGLGGDPFILDERDGSVVTVDRREEARNKEQLVRIDPNGAVTALAGAERDAMQDGVGEAARFAGLHGAGFAWAANGDLILTDGGKALRRVTPDGSVVTITDAESAPFEMLIGVATTDVGVIFAADYYGHRIYRIDADGTVETLAGTGARGSADGGLSDASFDGPVGLAIDDSQTLFVLEITQSGDRESARVRAIDLEARTVETVVVIADP